MFADKLKAKGWTQTDSGNFVKNDRTIEFDTGSWLMLSSATNPRVFDVPVPGEYESTWTVNLIEHLFRVDEETRRLRAALEQIRENPSDAQRVARSALDQQRR
jgi:hypothetical protein